MIGELAMSFDAADFQFKAWEEARTVWLRLSGTADLHVRRELDALLRSLHRSVLDAGLHEVRVDVRKLDFINSSCLKVLVAWLCTVQEAPESEQYQVIFVSAQGVQWQRRSLNALACIAGGLVSVQAL